VKLIEIKSLSGPNIYTYQPVIKMKVDLEEFRNKESKDLSGFNSKLLKVLPTLQEHHCSLGEPGGFLIRLKEGTYFGHIIEHVAIELLNLLGHEVNYGCTREGEKSGIYNIVYEYQNEVTAIEAGKKSYELVSAIVNQQEVNMDEIIKGLNLKERQASLGPSTQAIVDAAEARNIPAIRLGKRNSLIQLGYGEKQQRVQATIAQNTSCIGVDISCDKCLTKKLLIEMGLPVARGDLATNMNETLEITKEIEGNIVTKPYNSNQGKGISLNLKSDYEVQKGFNLAQEYSENVIIEEIIKGNDYRILVVNGKVVAVAQRIPAHVVGDGESTILELIQAINDEPLRGEGHSSPLTKIEVDENVLTLLGQQDYDLDSVLGSGEQVFLRQTGNLSTGGTAIDKTEDIHPVNCQLAVRAAKIIGLDIAGIDLITPDISQSILENSGAIIEVNAAPGIRMHHYPTVGKARDAAGAIVDMLFPNQDNGRIPIISITGTNGKTTVTRLIGLILQQAGYKVGMTTTEGIYINEECILKGDTTGPLSAQTILRSSNVEVAVLETARGGILRAGLGYDESDIGVITNISSDHLGQEGINSIEDLVDIKSLVIERINEEGSAILNADDQEVVKLSSRSNGQNIIYVSKQDTNFILRKHLVQGGSGVYIKENKLVINHNQQEEVVINIDNIPATYGGIAEHMVENILVAIASCIDFGIEIEIIREVLKRFGSDYSQNLGRLNIIEVAGVKVILDYGHNLAGYRATLEVAKELESKGILGVIGVPGDRRDEAIINIGELAGQYLQEVIVKEDQDLRGRGEGEVAELLSSGLNNSQKDLELEVILSEDKAVEEALNRVGPGQVLVIFYEKNPEYLLDLIKDKLQIKEESEILSEVMITE
jgi:cyanophycin synthetase